MPRTSVASVGGEAIGAKLDKASEPERIAALRGEFQALGKGVDQAEANLAATLAVRYSKVLAETYNVTDPVEVSNVLINLGLRRRGRCYELAEDLLAELQGLKLRTLDLHRSIAWKDEIWNEHNCVVMTARGQPFETGIVLDPWRNAGQLRWAPVKHDHYPWLPKPPNDTSADPSPSTTRPTTRPTPPPPPRPATRPTPTPTRPTPPPAATPRNVIARNVARPLPPRPAGNPRDDVDLVIGRKKR